MRITDWPYSGIWAIRKNVYMLPNAISKAFATYDQAASHRGILAAFEPPLFQRMMEQQEQWDKMFTAGLPSSTTNPYLDIAKKFEGIGVCEITTLQETVMGEKASLAGTVAPSLSEVSGVAENFGAKLSALGIAGSLAQPFLPTLIEQITSQQHMFDGLFKEPEILRMVGSAPKMPTGFVEGMTAYRDELVEELAEVVEAAPEAAEDALSQLAAQREAILKTLQRLNAAAGGCVMAGVHLPKIVVALMIWFWVFGDVAEEIITERASGED